MSELPSGTVTFLFTDIEGSTQLLKRLGARYGDVLAEHQRIIREAALERGGREVDTQGDSFFFAFARANAALGAAVVAQRALAEHDWPDGAPVRVRMGLHTGEPVVGEERYVGMGVHRAARIGAVGHGGQVLLSNATQELVENEVEGVSVRELGQYRLKDIERPERLYQLDIEGLETRFPPLRAERVAQPTRVSRRTLLAAALAGVIAAAVAIPIFAFGQGGSDGGSLAAAAGNSVGFVDPDSGELVADVAVGTTPTDVALGEGAVWVTNSAAGTVDRIDLASRTVRQTIRVGDGPDGIAFGHGSVWAANGLAGTVSRIDPRSSEVTQTIPVGNGPSGVAVGSGSVWIVNRDDRTVVRIDPETGDVTRALAVGGGPVDVAVGAGGVWVTSEADGKALRIDPRTGDVLDVVPVGRGPSAISISVGAVWVANTVDGTVSRIDPETAGVNATIPVGASPSGIAAGRDAVWVASEEEGLLVRVDPETNEVVRSVSLGSSPAGVAAGPEGVFVAVRPAAAAHRGGTLTLVNDGWVHFGSLDPALSFSVLSSITNDGLTAFRRVGGRQSGQIVPNLARSLPEPTNSGKTYTFRLREGIRYSTGELVRPGDIRRALERNFELSGDYASFWTTIVGGEACLRTPKRCDLSRGIETDESAATVTFNLTEPDPELLAKLAIPVASVVPQDTPSRRLGPREIPATGPYRVASYVPQRQIRMVRNPRFRVWSRAARPAGYPDEIVIRLDVSVRAQIRAIARGEADVADLTNSGEPDVRALRAQYGARLHSTAQTVGFYLWLNTRVPPFDDIRVRRALNLAVDRSAFVRAAGGPDVAAVTCQVLPANFPGYRPYCPYERDLATAKRLVAASGTRGMSVVVWTRTSFGRHYSHVVAALRALGYRARLNVVEDAKYIDTVNRLGPTAVQAGWAGWIPDYPTAGNFITGMLRYFQQRTGFSDRAIDRQIAQALELQLTDPAAADEVWARIDRMIVDQAPFVPMYNLRGVVLTSERVGNFQYHPAWFTLLDQLWVR
jgi:YVTN family beta-propeller protein